MAPALVYQCYYISVVKESRLERS